MPMDFDDFHDNITVTGTTDSRGPDLTHFPLPGRGLVNTSSGVERTSIPLPVAPPAGTRKVSGAGSVGKKSGLFRQQSNASSNLSRASSKSGSMASTTTTTSTTSMLRGRRRSQFPPSALTNGVANSTDLKTARKEATPIVQATSEDSLCGRQPSIGRRKVSADNQKNFSNPSKNNNMPLESANSNERFDGGNRMPKAKSLLPPNGETRSDLLTPTRTPELSRSSSTVVPQTPGRSTTSRAATPSTSNAIPSANKRMSVMPHHATGLGARTISPTDARRMKRMSMAPQAPPMPQSYIPQAPPTPQPEPLPIRSRQNVHSPASNYQKSVTPSSTRTTPDSHYKLYSSGQSLPLNTTFNSAWTSVGPSPRPPSNMSISRVPTPKPRSETVNGIHREDVPPVPAIPKAYESPQSEPDQPFFSARSSSLPHVDTPTTASPVATTITEAMKTIDTSTEVERSLDPMVFIKPEAYQPRKQTVNVGKKILQPLQLPPLNLLPLSTPTATRIKAIGDEASEDDNPRTPPPRRVNAKTPSTPMTASKATFFSQSHLETDNAPFAAIRSSTSHFALRPESIASRDTSTSPGLPFSFGTESHSVRMISPFTSSSLPKASGDFGTYMRPKFGADQNRKSVYAKPNGPRAPSFSIAAQKDEKTIPIDPDSAFLASAITRRLSLNKIRSTSKTKDTPAHTEETAKYGNMPPPKLPASATWSNLAIARSSPTEKPQSLKSRRKSSTASMKVSQPTNRHDSYNSEQSFKSESRPSTDSNQSSSLHLSRSSSLIHPPQTTLRQKLSSTSQLRLQENGLDRDDMLAEEEMKKLASKRKDFESAARQLDALRQRACAREALSPALVQTVNLNIFERGEIVDYKEVYFAGNRSAKKIAGDLHESAMNFGYDDDRGDYNIVDGDHLAYRYEVVDLLGKGSFGQVVRCIDHKTGILVAVKIIRNKKRFHQQALVEVNILQKLRGWVSYHGSYHK